MNEVESVVLTLGAQHIDRVISGADELLRQYRDDTGCFYLDYEPVTPKDRVVPEDIAVTVLINSQVGWRAFRSLQEYGHTIDLSRLQNKPLEETSVEERETVADVIAGMSRPGIAASVATKILHKKRPELIPILDNQAIFGAYMSPDWPQKPAAADSVWDKARIGAALERIAFDLTRAENTQAWSRLLAVEPRRTRIQLFDSIWWMYFRNVQPVVGRKGG